MKLRPKLTVAYIRQKFDQIAMFSLFLDIHPDIIIDCINTSRTIYSPIRDDDIDPSVGFAFDTKNRLKMKDFNDSFWGDIFDLVSHLYKLKLDSKSDFYMILKIIYDAMTDPELSDIITADIKTRLEYVKKEKLVIDLNVRRWNRFDDKLWENWGLSTTFIANGCVAPVENYWININSNPKPKYNYNPNNPCYAYYFGYDENGIVNYRLYFPIKSKYYPKFISNNNEIQGITTLIENHVYDGILITKSFKDVLLFRRIWKDYYGSEQGLDIGFVAPPAEGYVFSIYDIANLQCRTKTGILYSLFDFDATGIKAANRLNHTFNIPYLFLTNGKYNTYNYGAKDMTEYRENYGEDESIQLINTILDLLL